MSVIVLLGDINVDLALEISTYPPEGGEAIATAQRMFLGGSATNTAVALSRSGHRCRLIGRVGDDGWGKQALRDLRGEGIDTTWIGGDSAEPTQINVVTVGSTGERTMFAYRGANAQLSPAAIDAAAFDAAELFHLSGYAFLQSPQSEAADHAIGLAVARNIPITLDIPGGIVSRLASRVRTILPRLDTIVLGDADLAPLADKPYGTSLEEAVRALLDLGVERVAVKANEGRSLLCSAGVTESASWLPADAFDTTGAGDAFAAGHIHGRLTGMTGRECCRLANAFGALAVARRGAGLAMPAIDEALALLGASDGPS
ncbi:carbohydrate kinase family protein [Sinorhizobium medicae]|nr:carbohydrate kinase family protein [Sinorhizobium medicae]MDX1238436.1 carbohydrate kinase family protein [Sinorhizobium medicae]